MAKIVISEISQNYSWTVGDGGYATVALPITSCWGPGYFDPTAASGVQPSESGYGDAISDMLEKTVWQRFPATQSGLDAFVSTYRGPAAGYRLASDYSYQIATTLLTAGYDILVCRLCPGSYAQGSFTQYQYNNNTDSAATVYFRAKYPGTFGNNLQLVMSKVAYFDRESRTTKFYWNIITYVVDASGVKTAAESKTLVFNAADSTDAVLYYKEVESKFWEITSVSGTISETADSADLVVSTDGVTAFDATATYAKDALVYHECKVYKCKANDTTGAWAAANWNEVPSTGTAAMLGNSSATAGTDYVTTYDSATMSFENIAKPRYDWAENYQISAENYTYPSAINDSAVLSAIDSDTKCSLYYREWLFTHLVGGVYIDSNGQPVGGVFDLLKDKLAYNPNRIISPGWDDQDYYKYTDDPAKISTYYAVPTSGSCPVPISPLNLKIMDVAYYSRCATGYIDVPHLVERKYVHIEDEANPDREGYVQKLARVTPANAALDVNGSLFHTHCGFFAPWTQFQYVGTSRMNEASPSFAALMIQRAQILNQPTQYEWALPTNRKHNVRIGKLEYTVPKKLLDKWQKLDGASVNVITTIPDLGTNIWGNSTLFEVPPATYQALANLSTRFLVNAVEDVVYKCGISITFQYNNKQAYNKFYAGVTPLLDTMKNVGAIDGYRVQMSADIDELDHVNANTVIGKIWLLVNGVINDIYVDLIALPAGAGIDLASLT